jgi:nascent polypeptide-associated complex subunit alpha
MFGGINQKQMEMAMKKLGIKTENIAADEVIINGPKKIVIKQPQVTMMDMKGQKTFQIVGTVEESEAAAEPSIKDEDIKLVMEKTGADEAAAKAALEKSNGDIAEAIMNLTS